MESYIIGGLVGFSIGIFLYRFINTLAVGDVSPDVCQYCQWKKANEWRWNEKKDRHK